MCKSVLEAGGGLTSTGGSMYATTESFSLSGHLKEEVYNRLYLVSVKSSIETCALVCKVLTNTNL